MFPHQLKSITVFVAISETSLVDQVQIALTFIQQTPIKKFVDNFFFLLKFLDQVQSSAKSIQEPTRIS